MFTPGQMGYRIGGKDFALYRGANGDFYIFDPHMDLPDFPHGPLPGASVATVAQAAGLHGLGMSQAVHMVTTAGTVALNFVPVVGPVLSAISAIATPIIAGMFGGNDPTPASTLEDAIMQLRTQIADMRNQIAGHTVDAVPTGPLDSHHLPCDYVVAELNNITDPKILSQDVNQWPCDKSGVHCPGCGTRRMCYYHTIARLQPIAQQLAQQLNNAGIAQQVMQTVTGGTGQINPSPTGTTIQYPTGMPAGSATPATSPVTTADFSLGSLLPYAPFILVGIALIMERKKPRRAARPDGT